MYCIDRLFRQHSNEDSAAWIEVLDKSFYKNILELISMLNANKDIDFLTDQLREFAVPVFAINE